MIEAWNFLGKIKGVTKHPYHKEILYNVLLEEYSVINVNNLTAETLHPKNIVAKLYNPLLSLADKDTLVVQLQNTKFIAKKPSKRPPQRNMKLRITLH